ncbi:hypothetical protein MY3957_001525 [Beauveria namnaoensis]
MKTTLLIASLAAGTLAFPSDTYTVHQRRNLVYDARFEKRSAVDADSKIPFEIALKQGNLQEAEDKLYDMQVLTMHPISALQLTSFFLQL